MKNKSGRIENFKEYSQFKSLKEFNSHIEQWMVEYKHLFTKSERVALKRLVRYSAKYFGVCNAKIGTILKAINNFANGFGVSRSTFERMLNKAKEFGLLTVKPTIKPKGGKGHNVYVFNTIDVLKERKLTYCESNESPTTSKAEEDILERETSNLTKTSKQIINKRLDTLDYTFTLEYVPKQFRDLVKCFFDDAKVIEEYWKMVKIDVYYIKDTFNLDDETILYTAVHSFKQMINKLKKGKVNNPIAYFKGVFKRKIDNLYLSF